MLHPLRLSVSDRCLRLLRSRVSKMNERRMVGELERLGKNSQDFIVLGVDAPGFDELTLRQKRLAYYLSRAAIAGHTIADQQNHRHALEIRNLLETIYLHSDGMDPQING